MAIRHNQLEADQHPDLFWRSDLPFDLKRMRYQCRTIQKMIVMESCGGATKTSEPPEKPSAGQGVFLLTRDQTNYT